MTPRMNDAMVLTHYKILGVSHKASEEQIKTAYRRESLIWHPDRLALWVGADNLIAAQEISKRINMARDVLLDPKAHEIYIAELASQKYNASEEEFFREWQQLSAIYHVKFGSTAYGEFQLHKITQEKEVLQKQLNELQAEKRQKTSSQTYSTPTSSASSSTSTSTSEGKAGFNRDLLFSKTANLKQPINKKISPPGLIQIYKCCHENDPSDCNNLFLCFQSESDMQYFMSEWNKIDLPNSHAFNFQIGPKGEKFGSYLVANFHLNNYISTVMRNRGDEALMKLAEHVDIINVPANYRLFTSKFGYIPMSNASYKQHHAEYVQQIRGGCKEKSLGLSSI